MEITLWKSDLAPRATDTDLDVDPAGNTDFLPDFAPPGEDASASPLDKAASRTPRWDKPGGKRSPGHLGEKRLPILPYLLIFVVVAALSAGVVLALM